MVIQRQSPLLKLNPASSSYPSPKEKDGAAVQIQTFVLPHQHKCISKQIKESSTIWAVHSEALLSGGFGWANDHSTAILFSETPPNSNIPALHDVLPS